MKHPQNAEWIQVEYLAVAPVNRICSRPRTHARSIAGKTPTRVDLAGPARKSAGRGIPPADFA